MPSLLYQDAYITCSCIDSTVTLTYQSVEAAGAIGKAQGESWINALTTLQSIDFQMLRFVLNSSGAHFKEPMEGLYYLNAVAEKLWAFRRQGIHLQVYCPDWLYGGMAMVLASAAHEITLESHAQMGLFGSKILKTHATTPIPTLDLKPKHLKLSRLSQG